MLKFLPVAFLFILLGGCENNVPVRKGTVENHRLDSEFLQRSVEYKLYIPPGYDEENPKSDILYLLHGHGGDHNDWFQEAEGNVAKLLDSLISTEAIPPLVAVSANAGNSWYVDSMEHMESFYLNEFIQHVETSLNFRADFDRRLVGNSAGGYGALRFAFQKPEFFQSVILLSPAAYEPLPPAVSSSRKVEAFSKDGKFNDSVWQSYSYNHRIEAFLQKKEKPKFYLSVGDDDNYNIVPVVATLQQLFLENEIPNELRVMDGGHDWTFWKRSFINFLIEVYANNEVTP